MNRDIIAFTKYKFNVYGNKDIRSGKDSAVVGIVGKSKSLDFPTMLIFWSLVRNSVVLAVYLLFSVACFLTVHEHYLMALNEQWQNIIYYRLDCITNMRTTDLHMTPLRSIKGYENGIDYGEISSALPYMFADKPQTVEMIVSVCIIDQVIDCFGKDIRICDIGDGKFKVTLRASLNAMEYWAMQYLNFAEIVSPAGLREKIKQNIDNAKEKYK